jgi:tRNA pseudouridine55 synthase
MNGFLLIDKPKGWTSFDVVAKIRSVLRSAQLSVVSTQSKELMTDNRLLITPSSKVKVGHTGTLDPLATGLVVIVLGDYCKRAQEFSKLDKTYQVTAKLGQTSTTGDEEGEKQAVSAHQPTESEVKAALEQFTGQIQQTPPAYSAIKVNGQRAYKLAREGKAVKIEPRTVQIYEITDVTYTYPNLSFTTKVSSGTYIRTLAEDIGSALHTGAYTTHLHRTTVGPYNIKDAIPIPQTAEEIYHVLQVDLPREGKVVTQKVPSLEEVAKEMREKFRKSGRLPVTNEEMDRARDIFYKQGGKW